MRDYALLRSTLLSDLGSASGFPDYVTCDMDLRTAASTSLANSFYKKLCPNGKSRIADENALKKFLAIHDAMPDEFTWTSQNEVESCFWDYFRDHLNTTLEPHESWGSYDLDYIRESMMVGPGSAQKADSSSFTTKLFDGEMSFTNDYLISLYRAALAQTDLWATAEMRRFNRFGFTKVKGGNLFFAPKNAEISRTCCTEANLNMLIQRSAGAFLESRLLRCFGISLTTQPDYNRELARIGSAEGTFGTLDLVSASDSILADMVYKALRPSFLKTVLFASRSESVVFPDGTVIRPKMISTMGNGFTFPLQTVIFACAVRACYQLMGFPCSCPKTQFAVFGDDIIVRREVYEFCIAMLSKLGFSVNVGKSFNAGPFRESCGSDYFNGINIRGVYIKSLETPQHVYSAINRLLRWSARHDILLPTTMALLISWVRDIRIPPSEADDAGIIVPFLATKPSVSSRYWFKYRCYVKKVRKVVVVEPDADPAPFNPEGIGVGFLSGHVRRRDFVYNQTDDNPWLSRHGWSASVSIRDKIGARARYQIVSKSIPWWDYQCDTKCTDEFHTVYWRPPLRGGELERWETLVLATIQ